MQNLKSVGRVTGLFYLLLGITGMLGFLTIRPMLHDPADAAATALNLVQREGLARLGIALELGVVLSQALVAVAFYRLFRSVNSLAAGSIAAFGLVNAVAILVSAASMMVALNVALNPGLAPGGDAAGTAQLMYALSEGAWSGGALFFGLWLLPMGFAVIKSGWMPRLLGQILIGGGVGYVLSGFVTVLLPDQGAMASIVLSLPATVGEFWMMGYLLTFGVRDRASETNMSVAVST